MKKEIAFLFSVVLVLGILSGVFAQEETGVPAVENTDDFVEGVEINEPDSDIEGSTGTEGIDISTIDENAVLQETEGITPDSALYFFDEFFDRFGNDLELRGEKIAEIKAMNNIEC